MSGWDSMGAYTTMDIKIRNSVSQVPGMCIIEHMGCNSGMKRGILLVGFALVGPKLLEESSKTASNAIE